MFGNSSGAQIGLELAARHPEQVRALIAGGGGDAPDPEMLEMFARFEKNTDFFVGYEVPAFGRRLPDLDALRASSARIVLVAGEMSAGEPPYRATHALAGRLGIKAETYPGDHGGFGAEAEAFAARLDGTFTAS
ncbi:alpha/beta fold hydrolase [Actinomadura sp. 3N407]|uniref:alpha/beta fold hydrolase n=1 Tax=Actinomadura sp. 3N407 TaxID=3457423 RepID=UPI003FCC2BC5